MSRYLPQHMKRKKREFSKQVFAGVTATALLIAGFSCVMVWRTGDLTPLAYLIPAAAAETATATGFYYAKAKAENQIKLQKRYGDPAAGEGQEMY